MCSDVKSFPMGNIWHHYKTKKPQAITLTVFTLQIGRVLEISFDATDNADMFHILSRETH
jgi:hypothetical protein